MKIEFFSRSVNLLNILKRALQSPSKIRIRIRKDKIYGINMSTKEKKVASTTKNVNQKNSLWYKSYTFSHLFKLMSIRTHDDTIPFQIDWFRVSLFKMGCASKFSYLNVVQLFIEILYLGLL
jgi:hypothetical protein